MAIPTARDYLTWKGVPHDTLSTAERQKLADMESAMISKLVVRAIANKMHAAQPKVPLDTLQSHVSDVIDIMRRPGKEGCADRVSEYFLSKGYVAKKDSGEIKKLFSFPIDFDYRGVTGPMQAVGLMTSFLSSYPGSQSDLVANAIANIKKNKTK